MLTATAQELLAISAPSAHRPDYVQGGGGNTSAKSSDGTMAIKASGYELRQLELMNGVAWVQSSPVASYFAHVDELLATPADYEAESSALVKTHTFTPEPWPAARPSMETGFHSILQRYVVHTHSVYTNLINCREDGEQLLAEFSEKYGLKTVWIPYYNPGFWLTTVIQKALDHAKQKGEAAPQIFFLQNHGIIVTANEVEAVNHLHAEVNRMLCDHFQVLPTEYPIAEISPIEGSDYNWSCNSDFVRDFVLGNPGITGDYFEKNVLFPDQTVFFNGNFSFDEEGETKIQVNRATGQVTYHTNFREARTIDETLTAYLYIRTQIEKSGGKARFLAPKDLEYINGMESEVFRKSLLK